MTRYARVTMLLVAVFTLGLAACGGDDEEGATGGATGGDTTATTGGGGGASTLQLAAATPGPAFDKTSLEASAGEVTIDFTNDTGFPHNVTIEGGSADGEATDTITEGDASLTVDLEAGEYTYFCSVDDHRDAGMEGTLVVN
jgi:plastocyanin